MFQNKTIFVTGGAQGLGMGYVQCFLEKGANVFYGDVNVEIGRKTEEELQSKYGKEHVIFHHFDVTKSEQYDEAFQKAVSHFGNIDVLINNAGILNEGIWEKMIDINVLTEGLTSQLGIEVACLCPDPSDTDLIRKLDDSKVNNYDLIKDKLEAWMIPVSTVVEGLISMLEKDEINGAILLVRKGGNTYQSMERKDLGPEWPPVSSPQ